MEYKCDAKTKVLNCSFLYKCVCPLPWARSPYTQPHTRANRRCRLATKWPPHPTAVSVPRREPPHSYLFSAPFMGLLWVSSNIFLYTSNEGYENEI